MSGAQAGGRHFNSPTPRRPALKMRNLTLKKLINKFRQDKHRETHDADDAAAPHAHSAKELDLDEMDDIEILEMLRMGSEAVSLYSDTSDEEEEEEDGEGKQ